MPITKKNFYNHAPWLVLVVGSIVSLLLWNQALTNYRNKYKIRFANLSTQVVKAIKDRLDTYIDAHYAGVGLFTASDSVSRAEWRQFIKSMRLVERYPGINGLGYAVWIKDKDKARFEHEQSLTYPGFKIKPPGRRSDYMAIPYIEPIELNEPAIGFDMGSEANRRHALESSRDQGKAFISAKIILVQDAAQTPGFLTYVPIYNKGKDPIDINKRRENFRGWIYAPLIAQNFITEILNKELEVYKDQFELRIANDRDFSPDKILYSNLEKIDPKSFTEIIHIDSYGQEWSFRIQASPVFMNSMREFRPLFILLFGLLFSTLLSILLQKIIKASNTAIELKEQTEITLAQRSKFINAVLDTANDGIITINQTGIIQSYNRAAEAIFGYNTDEVINKNIKMLMPSPYHEEHDGYLQNFFSTGITKVIGIVREVSGKRKNGQVFPIELSVSKVETELGLSFTGIVRDISERKRIMEDLERSNRDLEQFAYIASHDLQEPLRTVSSYLEIIVNKFHHDDISDKERKYIGYITDGITRMRELISDVLAFSRVGSHIDFKRVNVQTILDSVLNNLQSAIKEADAKIICSEMPNLVADENEIYQLFQNLISNAIKFRAKDQKPIIEIKAIKLQDSWEFLIKDNGIGMKEDHFDKIFVIFQRLHRKNEYSGTGLGLAISKKIIERHGGQIWVESKYGEGTIFHFTISQNIQESEQS